MQEVACWGCNDSTCVKIFSLVNYHHYHRQRQQQRKQKALREFKLLQGRHLMSVTSVVMHMYLMHIHEQGEIA